MMNEERIRRIMHPPHPGLLSLYRGKYFLIIQTCVKYSARQACITASSPCLGERRIFIHNKKGGTLAASGCPKSTLLQKPDAFKDHTYITHPVFVIAGLTRNPENYYLYWIPARRPE